MKDIITDLTLLENPAEPVTLLTETGLTKEESESIMSDLREHLETGKYTALSAPQIGINKRVFGIKFEDGIKFFINPILTRKSGSEISPETFASMPGKEILISRPTEITAVYYTEEFKYEDNKFLGAAAKIFDQQYQVLEGVTPNELGLVSDIAEDGTLYDLTEDEMVEVVDIYKKFVQAKFEVLEKEIKSDEETTKLYKDLKFTESVINGRTQIMENPPTANREQRRAAKKMEKQIMKKEAKKDAK